MARLSLVLVLALAACEAAPTIGVSCTSASDCRSPLVCRLARCRTECRENRDCPVGATCLLQASGDGACGVDQDLGCETGIGRECPSGLTCVGDRCIAACTDVSDCPSDGVCTEIPGAGLSVCVDPRAPLDAATPEVDAATDVDASQRDGGPDAGILGIDDACIGGRFVCVLASGRVRCWGGNEDGQLGDGTMMGSLTPVTVLLGTSELSDATELACAENFACAIREGGVVVCWGDNAQGALGHADSPIRALEATPVTRSGGTLSLPGGRLAMGEKTACAWVVGGEAICWAGDYSVIRPDLAEAGGREPQVPSAIVGTPVDELAVGSRVICAITSGTRRVVCWGHDDFGQLGQGTPTGTVAATAVAVMGAPSAPSSLSLGAGFVCVLDTAGQPFCWGAGDYAQLGPTAELPAPPCAGISGHPEERCRGTAAPVGTSLGFEWIASDALGFSTCGVSRSSVYCWGTTGNVGETGSADAIEDPITGRVGRVGGATLDGVVSVRVGADLACALVDDGSLVCWSDNDGGQLRIMPDTDAHLEAMHVFP